MPRLLYQCNECNICQTANDLEERLIDYLEMVQLDCGTKDCSGTTFWILIQEEWDEKNE